MHNPRAGLAPDTAEIRHVVEQRVDERSGRMAGTWMHDQASGLVDDREVGILIQDVQRQGLSRHR